MSVQNVIQLIKENEVKFVDLRFTDTKGKEQHVSIPAHQVDEDFFEEGKMFDGVLRNSRGEPCLRDIVQFVPMNQFKGVGQEARLAKETLKEVPGQVCSYFEQRQKTGV